MVRTHEVIPRPIDALLPFLREGVTREIANLSESLNKFDPAPYGIIEDVLTDEGMGLLKELEVPKNKKCPEEQLLAHPVGGPLAQTMGRISLANMDMRHDSKHTAFSLKNETAQDFLLAPHRDLLDGHAVLFNYAVSGDLYYLLEGMKHPIRDNQLVVLNGAAIWGDITNFLPGQEDSEPFSSMRTLGGVTVAHSVVGHGQTSRNRLLVYADGRDTLVTQIPPELPAWF